ncbi:MAG: diguanylate cyclase [Marinobacter sp.]|uniref:sensor domain-containing diguanylate cyclase n=1 Tax=Marinobacter sp. TaxID=50741 RepID=UPI00299DE056|nr:diguanylate cyclase [Marinobacter sp.]MDX1633686.1 diguanylate cyclase [Marinobacter sp.]
MALKHTFHRWFDSLVNRAVTLVVLVVILTAIAVTLVNSHLGREELESQVREQMTTLSSLVARELDAKLSTRFQTLTSVASEMNMEAVTLEGRAKLLLDRQIALRHLFNALYLFDASGQVIAEYPGAGLVGFDAGQRAYFKLTSSQMTTLISEPFIARTGEPTIIITAPIFDSGQQFIGVLGGAIHLSEDNFMGGLLRTRLGEQGYIAVATRSGITLAHHRPDEVMAPAPRSNPAVAAALKGYEGVRFTRNSQGIRTMMAVRQLDQAPWFVAAVWPVTDAFAPVERLTDTMFWLALAVAALVAPIALVTYRRLLVPLADLSDQISQHHQGDRQRPIRVGGGREIRQVAETFNQINAERNEVLASLQEREAFFRALSQSSPIGIVQTDALGRIEFVNPAFESISGLSQDQLHNRYLVSGVYEADRAEALQAWRDALIQQRHYRGKFRLRDALSGRVVWVDAMTSAIQTPDKCMGTITVLRDITQELEVEEQLRAEQQRADSILGVLHEGVLLMDKAGGIRFANQAARDFIGANLDEDAGSLFDTVQFRDLDDRPWQLADFLAFDEIGSLDTVLHNRQGQHLDIELTMLRVNRDTARERLVLVLRDDSERRRREQRLSWEASHDSLTGLLNRRAFNAALDKWLAEAPGLGTPSVVMLVDLDYFKPVNDRGGHLLGDEMLRQLAQRLSEAVRQSDSVARIGGDEFAVLLPACGLERAETIAENLRAAVASVVLEREGERFSVTASIGVTTLSALDSGPKETLARADEGCYAAKARGRNCVVTVPEPPAPDRV